MCLVNAKKQVYKTSFLRYKIYHPNIRISVDELNTNTSAFQGIDKGNHATDFHNMGFKIQGKDNAWYFFTLVVKPASIQAFIDGTMRQSGSGKKQYYLKKWFVNCRFLFRERDLWHKVRVGLDPPKVDLSEKCPLHLRAVLQPWQRFTKSYLKKNLRKYLRRVSLCQQPRQWSISYNW